jgi:hypothetical protein
MKASGFSIVMATGILLLFTISCSYEDVPYSEGMGIVNSINGEVEYQFDKMTNEVKSVIHYSKRKRNL